MLLIFCIAPFAVAPLSPDVNKEAVAGTLVNATVTVLFGPDAGLLTMGAFAPVIFAVNLSVAFCWTFTASATVLNDF